MKETKRRNHNHARKAHETILRLLEQLTPGAGQRQVIDAKLPGIERKASEREWQPKRKAK